MPAWSDMKDKPIMSHTFFCCHDNCPTTNNTDIKKCGGCLNSWYCSTACQKADWKFHKAECNIITRSYFDQELFRIVADRLGCDTDTYTFDQFQNFMVFESHLYPTRSIQEWMEDWLNGFYTEDRERKDTLRTMFHQHGLNWSNDAYTLYQSWSLQRAGTRYEKMKEFIKLSCVLF